MKTVRFFTLGCKVNQYETEQMRERFLDAGFKDVGSLQKADTYVINTCTVTSTADRKSRYFIKLAGRRNHKAKIIVTGCYAELDSREIASIKGVSHIVKNKDKLMIPQLLGSNCEKGRVIGEGIVNFSGRARAFIKIQDGCDNRCSYCKVPLVRGHSRSRLLEDIIQEVKTLAGEGFQEIVLCGICLGSYGKDLQPRKGLIDIIKNLEEIAGLKRIRLSSIEAGDISQDLIQGILKSGKLCRHLHIPLQSGDDKILQKMNRAYRRQDYLKLIRSVRKLIPEIAITTDVMVGFPGEKEANFKNTLSLVEKVSPAKVHIFPYSPRKITLADTFGERLDADTVNKRVRRLSRISEVCGLDYRKRFLGQDMQVLIEGRNKEDRSCWEGHTGNYIKVLVKSGRNLNNKLVLVRLKSLNGDYVTADFC
jgi:threonylcarbamoyladenosine tRNA methylthiotransferase MtaB